MTSVEELFSSPKRLLWQLLEFDRASPYTNADAGWPDQNLGQLRNPVHLVFERIMLARICWTTCLGQTNRQTNPWFMWWATSHQKKQRKSLIVFIMWKRLCQGRTSYLQGGEWGRKTNHISASLCGWPHNLADSRSCFTHRQALQVNRSANSCAVGEWINCRPSGRSWGPSGRESEKDYLLGGSLKIPSSISLGWQFVCVSCLQIVHWIYILMPKSTEICFIFLRKIESVIGISLLLVESKGDLMDHHKPNGFHVISMKFPLQMNA